MITALTLHILGREVLLLLPPDTLRRGYYLFLHGSLLSPENYTRYLRGVAQGGYVVVAPKYRMHIFAPANRYGTEALAILDSVKARYGEGEACVGGHSMGAYIALKFANKFRCAVLLSLYLPFGRVPDDIRVPVLLFSGTADLLTPYPLNQMPAFRRASSDKALILLPGGTHNAYLDGPVWGDVIAGWPPFGQRRFHRQVAQMTVRFLNGYVRASGLARSNDH